MTLVDLKRYKWPLLLMAVLALAMGLRQWQIARSLNDGLSPIANAFSESNSIRAGEGYALRGFTYAWGLPDIIYGARFPDRGDKLRVAPGKIEAIYTHYPPGADWLAGLATMLFGPGEISRFRSIPILIGTAGLLVFAGGLLRFFHTHPWKAACAFAVTLLFPMTTNMMHGLHHHGYTTTLYLAQLAVLLAIVADGFKLSRWQTSALAVLGFLQGWLSFDNFPLVAFSSIPFSIAWWHRRAAETGWREHAAMLLLPTTGYALAHGLHFLQVAAYFGSLKAAYHDLAGAAAYRSGQGEPALGGLGTFELFWRYLVQYVPRRRFFGTPLLENLAIFILLVAWSRLWLQRRPPRRFMLDLRWQAIPAAAAAVMVGAFWIFVMTQHARHHGNYIPRNFLLAYLLPFLVVIDGLVYTPRRDIEHAG
jgi:hypothetical protein